ncbi:hypothetical protein Ae406Ps2_0200 [Pseudonocardia sp. Ae406_Ps2]|nr:hypothetical protein Ae406Ps2_0200 [Pseudonocardia sp. Ae406_Ps2]
MLWVVDPRLLIWVVDRGSVGRAVVAALRIRRRGRRRSRSRPTGPMHHLMIFGRGRGLGGHLRRTKLGVFSEKTPGPSGSARCARLLGVVGGDAVGPSGHCQPPAGAGRRVGQGGGSG